jgi:hypothetical protein
MGIQYVSPKLEVTVENEKWKMEETHAALSATLMLFSTTVNYQGAESCSAAY